MECAEEHSDAIEVNISDVDVDLENHTITSAAFGTVRLEEMDVICLMTQANWRGYFNKKIMVVNIFGNLIKIYSIGRSQNESNKRFRALINGMIEMKLIFNKKVKIGSSNIRKITRLSIISSVVISIIYLFCSMVFGNSIFLYYLLGSCTIIMTGALGWIPSIHMKEFYIDNSQNTKDGLGDFFFV
jgi:hypothetical protein